MPPVMVEVFLCDFFKLRKFLSLSPFTERAVRDQNVTNVGIPEQAKVVVVSYLPLKLPNMHI